MSQSQRDRLADFDRLRIRTIVTGKIITLTQLHIGSGTQGDKDDNPVIRVHTDRGEVPYIPGSSLKGVLRALVESSIPPDASNRDEMIYYIFGMSHGRDHVRGHVSFADCYPVDQVALHSKPGVAIDRVTGAAKKGYKYSIETVAPDTRFSFKMIIENIDLRDSSDPKSEALRFILRELKNGNVAIGGKTSSGLGMVRLELEKIEAMDEDSIKNLRFTYMDITEKVQL